MQKDGQVTKPIKVMKHFARFFSIIDINLICFNMLGGNFNLSTFPSSSCNVIY